MITAHLLRFIFSAASWQTLLWFHSHWSEVSSGSVLYDNRSVSALTFFSIQTQRKFIFLLFKAVVLINCLHVEYCGWSHCLTPHTLLSPFRGFPPVTQLHPMWFVHPCSDDAGWQSQCKRWRTGCIKVWPQHLWGNCVCVSQLPGLTINYLFSHHKH